MDKIDIKSTILSLKCGGKNCECEDIEVNFKNDVITLECPECKLLSSIVLERKTTKAINITSCYECVYDDGGFCTKLCESFDDYCDSIPAKCPLPNGKE